MRTGISLDWSNSLAASRVGLHHTMPVLFKLFGRTRADWLWTPRPPFSPPLLLGVAIAVLLSAVGLLEGCRPASEPSASSNVDEVVSFEPIFSFDGCSNLRYEHYGWRHFMRCGNSEPPIESQLDGPVEVLFAHRGCTGYRYEYYGQKPFVACGKGVGTPVSSQLSEPPEFLFHHEGCSVYRFEYYGWHYYADCGDWQEPPRESSKLEQPVEFLLEYDGCTGYRFEYYGWHYLTHCPETRLASSRRRALVDTAEPLFFRDGCNGWRYEYYGWHYVTQCSGQAETYITSLFPCGQNCMFEQYTQTVYR